MGRGAGRWGSVAESHQQGSSKCPRRPGGASSVTILEPGPEARAYAAGRILGGWSGARGARGEAQPSTSALTSAAVWVHTARLLVRRARPPRTAARVRARRPRWRRRRAPEGPAAQAESNLLVANDFPSGCPRRSGRRADLPCRLSELEAAGWQAHPGQRTALLSRTHHLCRLLRRQVCHTAGEPSPWSLSSRRRWLRRRGKRLPCRLPPRVRVPAEPPRHCSFRDEHAPRPARRGARGPLSTRPARGSEARLCCGGDGKPSAGRDGAWQLGSPPWRGSACTRKRRSAPGDGDQEGRPCRAVQSAWLQGRGATRAGSEGSGPRFGHEGRRRPAGPGAAASAASRRRLGRGSDCRDGPGLGAWAGRPSPH